MALRYKQEFEYLGENNGQGHLFRVTRSNDIFVNDKEPDSFIHELGCEVSKVIYPLDVLCGQVGNFKTVTNFTEIQERWSVKKEQLLTKFKDESVKKYIESVSQTMAFKERFLSKLKSDFFLAIYFKPIFLYYTAFLNFETNLSFPVLGLAKPVNFKINQAIDETSEDDEDKGTLDLTYLLNYETQVIEDIYGAFDLKFGYVKKIQIKMFLLE